MTDQDPHNPLPTEHPQAAKPTTAWSAVPGIPAPIRIRPELFQAAAERLVSQKQFDISGAASRLVTSSGDHGIDLSLTFATLEPDGRRVRQACLAVPGSGRTAMLFVSEPPRAGDAGGPAAGRLERAACVGALCSFLARERAESVRIAQGLPEPGEGWALNALRDAGFQSVGTLAYLRRPLEIPGDRDPAPDDPLGGIASEPGIECRPLSEIPEHDRRCLLIETLDRTYVETLDCPELCGLRTTSDILDSHIATGEFDPSIWWVVFAGAEPHGCMLLSRCPEQRSVELVYLGLGKVLRGRRIGRRLLTMGIREVRIGLPGWSMACAVDRRNTPALRLYNSLAFKAFGDRVALVHPLGAVSRA